MQRPTIRPLRLVRVNSGPIEESTTAPMGKVGEKMKKGDDAGKVHLQNPASGTKEPFVSANSQKQGFVLNQRTVQQAPPGAQTPTAPLPQETQGESEAKSMLKRTPANYLLNQVYGLWFFLSMFLLTVVVTRKLTTDLYGVYAVATAAANTINYILSLGLEDATTTFVPRVFAEHGEAAAARLIRRLLAFRLLILMLSSGIMLIALPVLAVLIAAIPISGSASVAASLRDPVLLGHITPIALMVVGNGIGNLFTAVQAALLRMRPVFIIGSITQVVLLAGSFVALQLNKGVDGILWWSAIVALLNAGAFVIYQFPLLIKTGSQFTQALKPVINVSFSAWLTNLVSGALLKQVSLIILGYYAYSQTELGYFNISFQLGHSANLLLVAGFGGVAGSALAAAFVGKNYERLSHSWQTIIKIETLLAGPVLVFSLFNAHLIVMTLYGVKYEAVGGLLAIFLFFNILMRVLGTPIHQSTLYVLGKGQLVIISQWVGMGIVTVLGIIFIPHLGPAGALMADGLAQVVTGGMLLIFLWRALPSKYPIGYTLRLLVGSVIAAIPTFLPGILIHSTNRFVLGAVLTVSGVLFLGLCGWLYRIIRPITQEDVSMVKNVNPKVASYLGWFARA